MPAHPKPMRLRIKLDARAFLPPGLQPLADVANVLQSRLIRFAVVGRPRFDASDFFPLMRSYMEKELGKKPVGLLLPWLLREGILERTSNFYIGRWAYGYRLGALLRDRPTVTYMLRDAKLIRSIRNRQHGREKGWTRERRHLKLWANRIEINEAPAALVVAGLEPLSRQAALEAMDAIINGETFSTFCAYGRAHTAITRLNRDLRPCLHFQGQQFVALDVANSQPLILGATMLQEILKGRWYPKPPRRSGGAARQQTHETSPARRAPIGGLSDQPIKGAAPVKESPILHAAPAGAHQARQRSEPGPRGIGAEGHGAPQSKGPQSLAIAPLGLGLGPGIRSTHALENASNSSSQQPVTQSCISPEVPKDLRKYLRLCEKGKLYDVLIKRCGWTKTRDEWKADVWFRFFYGSSKSKNWTPKRVRDPYLRRPDLVAALLRLTAVFKALFPTVHRWVYQKKRKKKGKLACDMQIVESKLIIGGVVGYLARHSYLVPIVTIHDALLVLPEHVDQVEALMRSEFQRLGVNPTIKRTDYAAEGRKQMAA